MKDKLQIALLSIIAVALVAIAVGIYTGDIGTGPKTASEPPSNVMLPPVAAPAARTDAATPPPLQPVAEPVDNSPKTSIQFGKYSHDFGNVTVGSKNAHKFTFTNTGKTPLLIRSAKGDCGCTVPTYPTEPIAPGATGEMEVVFSPTAGQENAQQKKVTVVANTVPETIELTIKAFVKPAS